MKRYDRYATYAITIPVITTTSLLSGTQGAAYFVQLQATLGTAPFVWTFTGNLDPGLTLSPSGIISGVPNTVATNNLTVTVTDANGKSASMKLPLTINQSNSPAVATASLPAGKVAVVYTPSALAASGGVPPYSWSVIGTLPNGMSLSTAGVLSGTPLAAQIDNLTFKVTDSVGNSGTAPLTLTIAANPPVITTASLPNGSTGNSYSATLQATGGVAPITWSATGSLDAGLSLKAATGVISGTPVNAETDSLVVKATDASGVASSTATLTLTVVQTLGNPSVVPSVVAIAGNGQITANFGTPISNGGTSITGYTARLNGVGTGVSITGATPQPISVPAPSGTAAFVTVHAFNSVGVGLDGTSNTVTPTGGTQTKAQNILANLTGLNTGTSKRVYSGQYTIYSGTTVASAEALITPLQAQTGKLPAMLGVCLNYVGNNGAQPISVMETLVAWWWAQNGFVVMTPDTGLPTTNTGPCLDHGATPGGVQTSAANFKKIGTPGDPFNGYWHAQLDLYAAELLKITANGNVVLFKPFIELDGNWNWYGAQNAADFIALWKDTYTYLMVTKGLAGKILMVFNLNNFAAPWTTYYPGDAWVDILSFDIYTTSAAGIVQFAQSSGNQYAGMTATGKPVIIGEIGMSGSPPSLANGPTLDNSQIISAIKSSLPNIVGYMVWDQGFEITHQNGASVLLNDAWSANLSDIPAGLN